MKKRKTTTTGIIMLGFLVGALLGALLLTLPISARPGQSIGFLDALFVSTSGICVTVVGRIPVTPSSGIRLIQFRSPSGSPSLVSNP